MLVSKCVYKKGGTAKCVIAYILVFALFVPLIGVIQTAAQTGSIKLEPVEIVTATEETSAAKVPFIPTVKTEDAVAEVYDANDYDMVTPATVSIDGTDTKVEINPAAMALIGAEGPGKIMASGGAVIPDAPTRGQASVIRFIAAETNYLGGLALDADGKVWTWGYNAFGMLGTRSSAGGYAGGIERIDYFVQNDINIIQIAGGYHTSYALAGDGTLYAWGRGLEGQMGNGRTDNNNPKPVPVTSIPTGVRITKVATTTEAASATYAIGDDGNVYAWGYASGNRIPGYSGYQSTARLIPIFDVLKSDGRKIVDIDLGSQHGIILDDKGQVWTWGENRNGQLGHGNTTNLQVLKKVDFFDTKGKVVDISAESTTSMAVTEDGKAYIWGVTYVASGSKTSYTRLASSGLFPSLNYYTGHTARDERTPKLVEFDLSSSPYNETAPPVAFATAGRYVSYVTDIYGRVWYFGWNVNYGFATDGPLFTTTNGGKHSTCVTNATLLRTLGDGDTQGYMNNVPAPVFSGATATGEFSAQYNSYNRHGQWSQMGDGLHPTIYDKKYMVTSDPDSLTLTNDYPLDAYGNRLVYVIRRESASPVIYSGNFYIAEESYKGAWCVNNSGTTALPAGVSSVTGVPAIKEDERSWIGLVVDLDEFDYTGKQLNEMPYITGISTYQSQVLFIDDSGNLYKQTLDGSGSIAWGWDYSKYEKNTAGNNATYGLYNFYSYEVMYMRGAPNVGFVDVTFEKPKTKIYLVEDGGSGKTPTDIVTVNVNVPDVVTSLQLNLTVTPELIELKYIFIPYDTSDPNFNNLSFSAEDFKNAWDNFAYTQKGSLLDEGITYTYSASGYTFEIDGISENGKIWVMAQDKAYTRFEYHTREYLVDNFYTPIDVNHRGLEYDDHAHVVYEPTDENVMKTTEAPGITVLPPPPPLYYGLPLDKNGVVIPDPTFGYDVVTVTRYNPLPGSLDSSWDWRVTVDGGIPQPESITLVLDEKPGYNKDSITGGISYTHDFYYDWLGMSDLEIEKKVEGVTGAADSEGNKNYAVPGEDLTYTITVKNAGTIAAKDVAIRDTLSELLPYIDTPSGSVTVDNNSSISTVSFEQLIAGLIIDEIDAGATVTVTYSVTVKRDIDVRVVTELINTVTVGGISFTAKIKTTDVVLTGKKSVIDSPALRDGRASPGETLTYTIAVINEGMIDAADVVIQDTLTEMLSHIDNPAGNPVTINGSFSGKTVADLMGDGITIDIPAGGTATVSFDVKVSVGLNVISVRELNNTAVIKYSDKSEIELKEKIYTGAPNIVGSKSVRDDNRDGYASPGEKLHYTIIVKNIGPVIGYTEVSTVFVKDEMIDILAIIQNNLSDSIYIDNNGYPDTTKELGDLINGFTIIVDPFTEAVITFSVTLKDDLDLTTIKEISNKSTHGEVTIKTGAPDLSAEKAVEDANHDGFASPGEELTYTITVTNNGDVDAEDVNIKDSLDKVWDNIYNPTSEDLVLTRSGSSGSPNFSMAPDKTTYEEGKLTQKLEYTINWTLPMDISGLNSMELELEYPYGKLENATVTSLKIGVTATSTSLVGFSDDTSGRITVTLKPMALFGLTGGEEITLFIEFDIPSSTFGVITSRAKLYYNENQLPDGRSSVNVDPEGLKVNDLINGLSTNIAAGETVTLVFKVIVSDGLDASVIDFLENTVAVTLSGKDITDPGNPPEAKIETGDSHLTIMKSVEDEDNNGLASPGEILKYTIAITNEGKIDATDVVVKDELAAMLTHIATPTSLVSISNDGVISSAPFTGLYSGITIPKIVSGVTVTVTFEVKVLDTLDVTSIKSLKNTVSVDGKDADSAEIPTGMFSKSVSDENNDGYASPGEELTYKLTFINNGGDMSAVEIKDDLSGLWKDADDPGDPGSAIKYIDEPYDNPLEIYRDLVLDADFDGMTVANLIEGLYIDIAAGETIDIKFNVTVGADLDARIASVSSLKNTTTAAGIEAETEIKTLGLYKDADSNVYLPGKSGQTVEYTISFIIPADMTGKFDAVKIVDIVPDGLSYVSSSAKLSINKGPQTSPVMTAVGNTLLFELEGAEFAGVTGKLVELTLKFDVGIVVTGSVINTAELYFSSDGGSTYPAEPNCEVENEVKQSDYSKDAFSSYYTPGEELSYMISLALPGDIYDKDAIIIYDIYDTTKLEFDKVKYDVILAIDGIAISADDYKLEVDEDTPALGENTIKATISKVDIDFSGFADKELILILTFDVKTIASGPITNKSRIEYIDGVIPEYGGGEEETTVKSDFAKNAAKKFFEPGGDIDYTIEVTLTENIDEKDIIEIFDEYEANKVSYALNSVVLEIGGKELREGNEYTIGNSIEGTKGTIKVTITAEDYSFDDIGGEGLQLKLKFKVLDDSGSPPFSEIENTAWIEYGEYITYNKDGDDVEEDIRTVGGRDTETVSESNFKKEAVDSGTVYKTIYEPGEEHKYAISVTLPANLTGINIIEIFDEYDVGAVAYVSSGSTLTIDGKKLEDLYALSECSLTIYDNTTGLLTITIDINTGADITKLEGKDLIVTLTFEIDPVADAPITNKAWIEYNGSSGGEDDETIYPPIIADDFKKEASPGAFTKLGDMIAYTISFEMPADLSGYEAMKIVDVVPDELSYIPGSAALYINNIPGPPITMLTDSDGNLYIEFDVDNTTPLFEEFAGTIAAVTLMFTVNDLSSAIVKNKAELYFRPAVANPDDYPNDYPDDPANEEETEIKLLEIEDFEKSADHGTFRVNGETVEYTISFKMPGDLSEYEAMRIVDILPVSGLVYQNTAVLNVSGGILIDEPVTMNQAGNTLTYTFPDPALTTVFTDLEDKTVAITLTFEISGWTGGPIENTAELYLKPKGGAYMSVPDIADDETIYPPLIVDDFYKTADAGAVIIAEHDVTYTISFTMPDDLSGYNAMKIVDIIPAELEYAAGSAMISIDGGTGKTAPVTASPSSLNYEVSGSEFKDLAGAKIELSLVFKIAAGWAGVSITNTAKLYFKPSDEIDYRPDPDAVDDEAVYRRLEVDDFEKSADYGTFRKNDELVEYEISFTMPSDLSGYEAMKIVDILPTSGLGYQNIAVLSIDGGAGTPVTMSLSGNTLLYELSSITTPTFASLAGKTISLTLTFKVTGWTDGPITNFAELYFKPTGAAYKDDPETEDDETIRKLNPPDDLFKTASRNIYSAGASEPVTYTISFTIPDDLGDYESFRIVDMIPGELEYVGIDALTAGGDAAVYAFDTSVPGEVSVTIQAGDMVGYEGQALKLSIIFSTKNTARGPITNNAKLYYTPLYKMEDHADDASSTIRQYVPPPEEEPEKEEDPEPTAVTLRARKTVTGAGARMVAGQFSFAVFEDGVQIGTATNDSAGNIVFPEIKYTEEGTHTYSIRETMQSGGGWVADARASGVTVSVTNENDKLNALVSYEGGAAPTFTNSYKTGKATLRISKVLVDTDGYASETGEIFWGVLYIKDETEWVRLGRYAIPANAGATVIPDLESGRIYQLVEEEGDWYNVIGHIVSMNSSVVGTSARPPVAFSIAPLSQDIVIDIIIHNEQIGPPDGLSFGGDPDDDPELIEILDLKVPVSMYIEDHFAYIIGYSDDTVRPESYITRAEAATVFFRLLTDDARADNWTQRNTFSDVAVDGWYNNAVSVMSNLGIINGYSNGAFRPDSAITRAELASIAARFAREIWMMPIDDRGFSDISGHWAENDIIYAAAIGWVTGYVDGTYRPNEPITRAELMTLVNRMLRRAPESADDLLPGEMKQWKDNADTTMWYYLAVQEATNSHVPEYKDSEMAPGLSFEYERWSEMMWNRDWSQLEKTWSTAYSG